MWCAEVEQVSNLGPAEAPLHFQPGSVPCCLVHETIKPKSRRILVVDDDFFVGNPLRRLLEFDGHQVEMAPGSKEALALFAKSTFDLVIADYEMSGIKGDQLAVSIKAIAAHLPIILITAYVERLSSERNPLPGVDLVLPKPFSIEQLREAITRLLP